MAHLNWHGEIVKVYKSRNSETRFHITNTDKVIRTQGPRLGGAKIIRTSEGKFVSAKAWQLNNLNALNTNFDLT